MACSRKSSEPQADLHGGEHRVDGGRLGNVAMADHQAVDLLGQRLDPLLERVALIGEGKFGAMLAAGPRDAPGDRAVVGDAHDQPAFAAHQARGFRPLTSPRAPVGAGYVRMA